MDLKVEAKPNVDEGITLSTEADQFANSEITICSEDRDNALFQNLQECGEIALDVVKEMGRIGYDKTCELGKQVQDGAAQAYQFGAEVAQEYPAQFEKMYGEPLRQAGEAVKEGAYQVTEWILQYFNRK